MLPIDLDLIAKGRKFEFDVAGVTVLDNSFKREDYVTFRQAQKEVVSGIFVKTGTREVFYYPENPNRGLLPVLFQQVRLRLQEKLGTTNKAQRVLNQLRLYIAINTKLDLFHGVDIFFTLRTAESLLDITLFPGAKKRQRMANEEKFIKNRLLVTERDVGDGFRSLGESVSNQLFGQHVVIEERKRQDVLTAEFMKQKIERRKWDMVRVE